MKTLEDRRINLMARIARAQRDHKPRAGLQREFIDVTARLLRKLIRVERKEKRAS